MKEIIIGLVGTSGSGKSTTAKYLQKKGFYKVELSSFIRHEAKKRKIKNISKKVLQNLGNMLRKSFGASILVQKAVEEIKKKKVNEAVIDGIRNPSEIAFLKTKKNFYLLGITAKPFIRYQRIIALHGKNYIGTYQDFLKIERRDSELGNKNIGLRVKDCLKKCSLVIMSNNSGEDLYKQIDNFIKSLKDIR